MKHIFDSRFGFSKTKKATATTGQGGSLQEGATSIKQA
jgi:hypothetical protein